MPELPEVQTVINTLNSKILNKTITNIKLLVKKVLKNIDENNFINSLNNNSIISINRKGKYIILNLNNNLSWIVHLRMEGKFFIKNKQEYKLNKHTIFICDLDNDSILAFEDTRRFATFDLVNSNQINEFEPIKKLAQDPLEIDFDLEQFYLKLNKSKKNIKTNLLDQTIVSGIGNIYVDEILFDTKIHPLSLSNKLSFDQISNILSSSISILEDSIKHKGSTISSFKFDNDHVGSYQNYLKIHNKNIKNCLVCNNPTSFIKVGGRGTYCCETCQKLFK